MQTKISRYQRMVCFHADQPLGSGDLDIRIDCDRFLYRRSFHYLQRRDGGQIFHG